MATWLHDSDSLCSLSDEDGLVGQWAMFHSLVQGDGARRPTSPWFSAVSSLLGGAEIDAWGAEALRSPEVIADFRLLVEAGVVRPTDAGVWLEVLEEALPGPHGASAGDLLLLLGLLKPTHIRPLVEHHAAAPTLFAWLLSAAPDPAALVADLSTPIREDLEGGGGGLSASVELLSIVVPVAHKTLLEAVRAGSRDAGFSGAFMEGVGSHHRRAARLILSLLPKVSAELAALVEGALGMKLPLPTEVGYAIGWTAHAEGRLMPIDPESEVSPLVLAAEMVKAPDRLIGLLDSGDAMALWVARFVPTEEVLEALIRRPLPVEEAHREQLAIAMAMMGSPAVSLQLRGVLEHLQPRMRETVHGLYEGLLGRPLE